MCDCGCGTCGTKQPVVLNESIAPKAILSEGLKYHVDNARPLTEHVFRAGSENYFNLWAEARALYARNILEVQGDDLEVLLETDLGHFGMVDGKKVPLDFPMLDESLNESEKEWDAVDVSRKAEKEIDNKEWNSRTAKKLAMLKSLNSSGKFKKDWDEEKLQDWVDQNYSWEKLSKQFISESATKAKKKNTKKLNKPMRDSSGGKAYKVYVKDPKTGNIKTIRFGSGGLRAKINNKDARNAFAARHKCSTKKDKTKAGYWSCRLPRYAKLLGLKSNFSGFW